MRTLLEIDIYPSYCHILLINLVHHVGIVFGLCTTWHISLHEEVIVSATFKSQIMIHLFGFQSSLLPHALIVGVDVVVVMGSHKLLTLGHELDNFAYEVGLTQPYLLEAGALVSPKDMTEYFNPGYWHKYLKAC
ncbi:hypothetical protein ACJX0J_007572 [Zea mays]